MLFQEGKNLTDLEYDAQTSMSVWPASFANLMIANSAATAGKRESFIHCSSIFGPKSKRNNLKNRVMKNERVEESMN